MPRASRSTIRNSQRPTLPKASARPPLTFVPLDTPDADAEEVRAFKPLPGRDLITERSRRVSAAALQSASTRMRGPQAEEDEENEDRDEDEAEVEQGNEPELAAFAAPPPSAKALASQLFGKRSFEDTPTTPATATAVVPQAAPTPALRARPLSVLDGDRLWDWIRQDGDQGHTLFGRAVQSSIELHTLLHALAQAEPSAQAMIRALDVQGSVLGFVTLNPILANERTALVTIYLAPEARGQYVALLPHVLEAVAGLTPLHLAFPAFDAQWVELYRRALTPIGFTEHTLFVR